MNSEPFQDVTRPEWPHKAFRRLLWPLLVVGSLIALVLFMTLQRRFTSTAEVLVSAETRPRLSGALAALSSLGASTGGDAMSSPFFVASLFTSREVLDSVLIVRLAARHMSEVVAQAVVPGEPVTREMLLRARTRLASSVTTGVDARTGAITLAFSGRDPASAQEILSKLIQAVDLLMQRVRHEQARQRREFVQSRVMVASADLRTAEDAQIDFRRANAVISAPQLAIQERRLQRAADRAQELYMALMRDREEALQEESRNTASLNLIVSPDLPMRKSWPSGSLLVASGLLTGAFVTLLLTLVAIRRASPDQAWPPPGALALVRMAVRGTW